LQAKVDKDAGAPLDDFLKVTFTKVLALGFLRTV